MSESKSTAHGGKHEDSGGSTPSVVMRSHNDMPLIVETLERLHEQNRKFELICLDNDSTDGTVEELRKYTSRIVNIPAGSYVPGRVLNLGMEMSGSEKVVFLNSDCAPQNESWLDSLLRGFEGDSNVAAVFGRQIPRPDCHPLHAKDTDDTYGDGVRQQYWRHCFSMASSAISRSVWQTMRFSEELRYSEDIDWTWRARQRGAVIRYVPDSIVMHSHNYTLRQLYRRHFGEGFAEASIFQWSPWEASLLRYSLLPYGRQILSDWSYCVSRGLWSAAVVSPVMRFAQMVGRRRGFSAGLNEKSP